MAFNVGDPVKHVYQDGIIGKVTYTQPDITYRGTTITEAMVLISIVDGADNISFRPQDLQLCRCANRRK